MDTRVELSDEQIEELRVVDAVHAVYFALEHDGGWIADRVWEACSESPDARAVVLPANVARDVFAAIRQLKEQRDEARKLAETMYQCIDDAWDFTKDGDRVSEYLLKAKAAYRVANPFGASTQSEAT